MTYSTDAYSYTFATHYGTMMPYSDSGVPSTDFFYGTHRYRTEPNFTGQSTYLAATAYARLKFEGNQAVFVLVQVSQAQFDDAISYPFYGCTVRGAIGGAMYDRKVLRDAPYYGRVIMSENCEGKTKDNVWDWLIGKVITGDDWTGEYCYLNPSAHDRVQTTLTINSVQYL